MQTILVCGGAGFIGSHLCEKLLNEGNKVVCVDNLITGNKKNIETFLSNPNFLFVEHDIITSNDSLSSKLKTITSMHAIFHLASPASPNKKSPRSYMAFPIETLLVNSVGTYNLLELAKRDKAKFLYVSSSEVYGDPAISPQDESYFGNVNPVGVRSVYDEGKRFGEAITMAYVRKFGLNARIVRIFNTFGPKMQKDDGRVISNFITQAIEGKEITVYGTGDQTRSFCFVSDMVAGLIKAMFAEKTQGEVINLGNQNERTINDLAHEINDMVGSSASIAHQEAAEEDPKRRKPNIEKAKKLLGWEPSVNIKDGLEKTITYFHSI